MSFDKNSRVVVIDMDDNTDEQTESDFVGSENNYVFNTTEDNHSLEAPLDLSQTLDDSDIDIINNSDIDLEIDLIEEIIEEDRQESDQINGNNRKNGFAF